MNDKKIHKRNYAKYIDLIFKEHGIKIRKSPDPLQSNLKSINHNVHCQHKTFNRKEQIFNKQTNARMTLMSTTKTYSISVTK